MESDTFKNIVTGASLLFPLVFKRTKTSKIHNRTAPNTSWRPQSRNKTISRLRNHVYDILVIGGGSAGAGVALDATTRGFSVALIEQNDFASGTSSKSSKLLHGGIRYLEKAWNQMNLSQLKFVKEALTERGLVMKMIPHLSKSIDFMIPIYNRLLIPYYYVGLKLYDYFSMDNSLGNTKFLNKSSTIEKYPNIKSSKLLGSVIYKDGFFLDFRANIMLIMTAAFYGSDVINYLELIKFKYTNGQISEAVVYDKINNQQFSIKAKVFISTAGPFTDNIRRIANEKDEMLETSSGSHIVLNNKFGPIGSGFVDPKTDDNRLLFFVPFEYKIICGSTDRKSDLNSLPQTHRKDVDFLLNEIRKYLRVGLKVSVRDILSTWCGIRPLVKDTDSKTTGDLLRTHVIKQTNSGLIVLSGGKWTTFRKMAKETVDFVIQKFNFPKNESVTHEIKSIGAHNFSKILFKEVSKETGLSEQLTKRIQDLHGDRLNTVKSYLTKGPSFISEKYDLTKEEVNYQIDNEFVMKPADVLLRRTGIAFFDIKEASNCVEGLMELFSKKFNYGYFKYKKEKKDLLDELKSNGLWLRDL